MKYYKIEFYDYRYSKHYTHKIWSDNEYDAWNMCLYTFDPYGYELGRGEQCSKNILITSVYIIGDGVNGLYKEVA